MMIINPYRYAGAPLLLDMPELSGVTINAAYSLRKLRDDYAGSAIRVRRSSDNAELDVGFVGNALDTASLLAFVGAGDGFIAKWYPQSVSGPARVQTTTTRQARIVNSGVLDTEGGKPASVLSGAQGYLFDQNEWFDPSEHTVFALARMDSPPVETNALLYALRNGADTRFYLILTNPGGGYQVRFMLGTTANVYTFHVADSARHIYTVRGDASEFVIQYDDNSPLSGSGQVTSLLGNSTPDSVNVNSTNVSAHSNFFGGPMTGIDQEMIFLQSKIDPTPIINNINAYYGVY